MKNSNFEAFYHEHVDSIWRVLARMGLNDSIEDVCQEVFVKAWRKRDQFRAEADPKTWLTRIALNEARSCLRKKKKFYFKEFNENDFPQFPQTSDRSLLHKIEAVLNVMSTEHREVLVLSSLEEMKLTEISELLGIPVETVRSRLFYARKSFKKLISRKGGPGG